MPVVGIASFAVLVVSVLVALSGRVPRLTREALERGRRIWTERGPRAYELVVEMDGGQIHTIRVAEGRVVEMRTGGVPVPESARGYWTVEGMFAFLEAELDNARDPRRAYGVSDPTLVVLRAEFDPEFGFPRRFLRYVSGRGMGTGWTVRRFRFD